VVGARGTLTRALGTALTAAEHEQRDAGTVALARRYAALIDAAAVAAKYRRSLEAVRSALLASESLEAEDALEHFNKLADALAEHSVASDLGPKLLAALTSLGLTPAGRGVKGVANAGTVASALDELKARRASRAERARQH
jgi:hypothetical protein